MLRRAKSNLTLLERGENSIKFKPATLTPLNLPPPPPRGASGACDTNFFCLHIVLELQVERVFLNLPFPLTPGR
jgi:hypothetical protein